MAITISIYFHKFEVPNYDFEMNVIKYTFDEISETSETKPIYTANRKLIKFLFSSTSEQQFYVESMMSPAVNEMFV